MVKRTLAAVAALGLLFAVAHPAAAGLDDVNEPGIPGTKGAGTW